MAEVNVNAKIFVQMQAADQLREDMKKGILARFKAGMAKQAGALSQSTVGGLRDAYRRVFEQGWYGKDIFDGRFHMDNQVGKENQTVKGMGQHYDFRAGFYGWDQEKGSEKGQENTTGREVEQDIGR